jgi:hypothetical protein
MIQVVKLPPNKKQEMDLVDPESLSYLEKFEGKKGQVFDITTTSSGYTNYHVNFGSEIGIFYKSEVTLAE